ncbi:LysR family transcriptional regulator [Rhodoferax sp.]|uniref:LysR family transcriptional regulator n=1 Tax=Rhodoferax sp. TaxID=50421 RepID=UPI0008C3B4BF|nr:LysR family transcriptional regulator [Rhodoferax sp.]OGB59979.1 MAG: LysR family transcriptional regulator [Burkholderiales bacterium RIFOXYD12_FULL_59_19]OGB76334.1 MAG: LysR family transcriptional regulator [Burkholderiales bacterium RIFOXYC12_FULL_60_6]OGB83666.1 MAG: LysR family transcriptional regulator [Burkholderiales bacterium RIFOXYD2_FULL_59_8]MDO8318192.1 LysR family transcriptional regulator [Rhodoferax sp.]MDP2677934.1 LysR family transcriptional regulator [Rhodoferax sp.]
MEDSHAARRPRHQLKTRQMALLMAIDESRNLHQAALATHMSQPAASKMLKDMEELFGVTFFERLPRGMRPTIYGETLIRHVRMALDNLAQGQSAIAALQAGLSGQVRMGVILTPSMTLVPQAIAATKAEAPRLSIGVEVGTSDVLVDGLKRGRLDFLIARIPAQEEDLNLVYEDLSEETECAVVRLGHPLLAHTALTLQDLGSSVWILSPRGSILRHQFDMLFRRNGLAAPINVIETTAMSVIKALLQQTDFLHLMPLEVARYYAASGELSILPIELPCNMDSYGLIMRSDHVLTPGASLLLGAIRRVHMIEKPGVKNLTA